MNTPILTSQDAFSAMMSGKNILCRAIGEMLDFNDLDQFPATIFAQPGYEFCIKIDTIEVAGITFTVPLTLDEIQEGQELFVVNTYGASIYIVDFSCNGLTDSVNAGFVQRDAENAKLQLQAMSKLMGRELSKDLTAVRLGGDKPKTPRKTKTKAPVVESTKIAAIDTDSAEVAAVGEPKAESNIVDFNPKTLGADEFKRLTLEAESFLSKPVDAMNQAEHIKLLREKITAAQSSADLDALLPQIRDVGGEHGHALMLAHADRDDELKCLTSETADLVNRLKSEISNANTVEDLLVIDKEISSLSQTLDSTSRFTITSAFISKKSQLRETTDAEVKRQQLLNDLLKNVINAQTPAEANAQFRYARGWTTEQCKPLHVAISKRLVELDDSKPVEVQTLMELIQHAPDLTTLDVLEIDVGARPLDMQKRLMAEVVKRRKALEDQEAV